MSASSYASHVREIETFGLGLSSTVPARDHAVLRSWRRCIERHQLDPAATCEAYIVPEGQLRAHREESASLIRMARSGLERLYQQLSGLQYVLLLADRHGVAVDFLGHEADQAALRRAGLFLGAEWREERAGTCAVGACLASGEAITVHQSDHFDFTHAALSCTAAPIYDCSGELAAVLDLSLLRAPDSRASQSLALHLVASTARRIELAHLMAQSGEDWVLALSRSPDFLDVEPEAAITVDGAGCVSGMTHAGARLLAQVAGLSWAACQPLVGQALTRFLALESTALPSLLRHRPAHERRVQAQDGTVLFAHAIAPQPAAPPRRAPSTTASATPALPPVLAALSAGDPAMAPLLHQAGRLAKGRLPILLQGETGVGKERLARALHTCSGRSGRFVALNCAALPESLLESELFGYLPGAWTGAASRGRTGLIEAAHQGTLFLDEIGDMPAALQAKLLRVLGESEVTPLGAHTPRVVDVRVVSASHRPLASLVAAGTFREDLLYRLNTATLVLPPLRARQDVSAWIDRLLAAHGTAWQLAPEARACLLAHHWPGNLRELDNVLAYAVAVAEADLITCMDLPVAVARPAAQSDGVLALSAQAVAPEVMSAQGVASVPAPVPAPAPEQRLQQLLAECGGNVSDTARRLGVSRSTVHRQIHRLHLGQRQVHWAGGGTRSS